MTNQLTPRQQEAVERKTRINQLLDEAHWEQANLMRWSLRWSWMAKPCPHIRNASTSG
jgi:hypothetical protein